MEMNVCHIGCGLGVTKTPLAWMSELIYLFGNKLGWRLGGLLLSEVTLYRMNTQLLRR